MGLCVSVLPITKGGRVESAVVNQRQFFTRKNWQRNTVARRVIDNLNGTGPFNKVLIKD